MPMDIFIANYYHRLYPQQSKEPIDIVFSGENKKNIYTKVREKMYKNIDEAVILVCDFTIKYNIDRRRIIHPNTLFTRNSLLKGDN